MILFTGIRNFLGCGHCRNLVPEYEKAATLLKGVVKLVAVDATQAESLASKYQVCRFSSIILRHICLTE
jgi:thiol-disulfide isomerase/thioredoxin